MNTLIQTISSYLQPAAFTAPLLDAWLKSVAVLAVAGGLCLLLPRAAAATRHWIWCLAVTSLPCLLLLSSVPHSWHRPLWSVSSGLDSGNQSSLTLNLAPTGGSGSSVTPVSLGGTGAAATVAQGVSRSSPPIAARFSTTWLTVAFVIWFLGALLGWISVLLDHVRLLRLTRHGAPLETSDWALLLRQAGDALHLRRRVSLWQSADNVIPLTWGWWQPVVLLPAEAAHWLAQRRRIVLLHELAHVKRWDCLIQTVARMVCALYWINPLVWLAARQMCVERERACDDLVLNGGCKASDYASELVAIAQAYRHIPQVAAIAMARSSQIKGRIDAIVDASRARRARPLTAFALMLCMGTFLWSVGGSNPDISPGEAEASSWRQQQLTRLQSFAQAKEKQARELAANAEEGIAAERQRWSNGITQGGGQQEEQARDLAAKGGNQISPAFQRFFDAATKGDWRTVTNRYEYFKEHHPQYRHETNAFDESLITTSWQPVLEVCLAYDQVVNCEPKYTALLADGIINSIPAGSIYFGGTVPGRGVPTAFCKSQVEGDPFFTLTQNALANGTYLDYLLAMYAGKIYTPTLDDSQRCFQEYMSDAQRRFQANKLKPGEDVKISENRVQISGQVAVMSINGLLTKVIFDHNPDREFYVEESFPLDWMYPYLEPHGLIMKLNRQPLAQILTEMVAQDREYWRKVVAGMLGDWLDEKTSVSEVAGFVDRVYVHGNLKGFTGDPRFVQNDYAKKTFSKLRSSIGGLYAWRLNADPQVCPPEYRPKSKAEHQRLLSEADLAFRQAFVLCPSSPEALFRYVSLLLQFNHVDDALLLAQVCLKLDPNNSQVMGLLNNLQGYKKQQTQITEPTNNLANPGKQVHPSRLTGAQAEALAERLANEKSQELFKCQPFRNGTPAKLVQGYWVWHDLRAQGPLDVEANVKFAEDGTHPDVCVILLDNRPDHLGRVY